MQTHQNNNQFIQFAMQLLERQSSSPDLEQDNKDRSIDLAELDMQLQSPIKVIKKQSVQLSEEPCHCYKSGCQKMYCECLAKGRLCSAECRCLNCHNHQMNPLVLDVLQQLDKNKHRKRFRSYRFKDGCTCQKSQCTKKYCECYHSGRPCGDGCKCVNCENVYSHTPSKKKVKCNSGTTTLQQFERVVLRRIEVQEFAEPIKIHSMQLMILGMR